MPAATDGVNGDDRLAVPADVLGWIEEATGRSVAATDRIPRDGTRPGWFVERGVRPTRGWPSTPRRPAIRWI
jgi:hypothetical protein